MREAVTPLNASHQLSQRRCRLVSVIERQRNDAFMCDSIVHVYRYTVLFVVH